MSKRDRFLTVEEMRRNWERYHDRPHPPIYINGKDRIYYLKRDAHLIMYGHTRYLEREIELKEKQYREEYKNYIKNLTKWAIKTICKDNSEIIQIQDYDIKTLINLFKRENIVIKDDLKSEIGQIYRHYSKCNIFLKYKYKILIKNQHYSLP